MNKIEIQSEKVGAITLIVATQGKQQVKFERVGDVSQMTTNGQGNVRTIKSLIREVNKTMEKLHGEV